MNAVWVSLKYTRLWMTTLVLSDMMKDIFRTAFSSREHLASDA